MQCLTTAMLLLGCSPLHALELVVVDQFGQPLSNAVLELGAEIETDSADHLISSQAEHGLDIKAASPFIMDQVNKAFVPSVLIIPQQSWVEFPNSDNIRHHVYSFSNTKPFELRLYSGKPKDPIQFEQEGVVVLGCNIHDSMVGYIYVTHSPYTYKTDRYGTISLDALPEHLTHARIWHPNLSQGVNHPVALPLTQLTSDTPIQLEITTPTPRKTFEAMFRRKN
jgi:plastocyanin